MVGWSRGHDNGPAEPHAHDAVAPRGSGTRCPAAGADPAQPPDNGLIIRYIRLRRMARTWERACSRVRLGHVIRYIGRGRAAAKALRTPDAIHGPRRRSNCGPAP